MAKSKDTKYKEAVARNTANALKRKPAKYVGKDYDYVLRSLGIRKADEPVHMVTAVALVKPVAS